MADFDFELSTTPVNDGNALLVVEYLWNGHSAMIYEAESESDPTF